MKFSNYYRLISEGKKDSRRILTNRGVPEDVIEKILDLDQTASKADSVRLGVYYLEIRDFNMLEQYYKKFLELKRRQIVSDINKFKTWHDFENIVDSNEKRTKIDISGKKESEDALKNKYYSDDNIDVYLADSTAKAILYSHELGQDYSFCIGRKGSGNAWVGYRLRLESTFYFIRFKNRSNEIKNGEFVDPSHLIVLDASKNGFLWTWADNGSQGHGTTQVDSSELLKTFPELSKPFAYGFFRNIPLNADEHEKLKKFQKISEDPSLFPEIFAGLSYVEKKEYIGSSYNITGDLFQHMDSDLKVEYCLTGGPLSFPDSKNYLNEKQINIWKKYRKRVLLQLDHRITKPFTSFVSDIFYIYNENIDMFLNNWTIWDYGEIIRAYDYLVTEWNIKIQIPEKLQEFWATSHAPAQMANILISKKWVTNIIPQLCQEIPKIYHKSTTEEKKRILELIQNAPECFSLSALIGFIVHIVNPKNETFMEVAKLIYNNHRKEFLKDFTDHWWSLTPNYHNRTLWSLIYALLSLFGEHSFPFVWEIIQKTTLYKPMGLQNPTVFLYLNHIPQKFLTPLKKYVQKKVPNMEVIGYKIDELGEENIFALESLKFQDFFALVQ